MSDTSPTSAALLLRLLEGELTEAEQRAVVDHIRASAQARDLLFDLALLNGNLPSALQELGDWQPDDVRAGARPARVVRPRWRPVAAVAGVACAAAVGLLVLGRAPAPAPTVRRPPQLAPISVAPVLPTAPPAPPPAAVVPDAGRTALRVEFDQDEHAALLRRGTVVACPPGARGRRCLSGVRMTPRYEGELGVSFSDWKRGFLSYRDDLVLSFSAWVGATTSPHPATIKVGVWTLQDRKFKASIEAGHGASWTPIRLPLADLRADSGARLQPGDSLASIQIILQWKDNDLFLIDQIDFSAR